MQEDAPNEERWPVHSWESYYKGDLVVELGEEHGERGIVLRWTAYQGGGAVLNLAKDEARDLARCLVAAADAKEASEGGAAPFDAADATWSPPRQ